VSPVSSPVNAASLPNSLRNTLPPCRQTGIKHAIVEYFQLVPLPEESNLTDPNVDFIQQDKRREMINPHYSW
jgi:hypothetical protein